jgi:hypothetical protein
MISSQLTLLVLFIFFHIYHSYDVAVCISGQTARWLPEQFYNGIIQANPGHVFHLFFNLQYTPSKDLSSVFTTNSLLSFQPTPINKMNQFQMFDYLHEIYGNSSNSKIESFQLVPPKSIEDWEKTLNSKLDRIYLYTNKQNVILNLFMHHRRCYEQILFYEEFHPSNKIDFVINTREDIFFFKPISLQYLFPNRLKENLNRISYTNITLNSIKQGDCNLVVKDCLKWFGVNMRFQLFSRDHLQYIMGKKISYYKYLIKQNQTVRNPEIFEAELFKHYRINICEYSVNDLPLAAIRYVDKNLSCFIPQEIDGCTPQGFEPFARSHRCTDVFRDSNKSPLPPKVKSVEKKKGKSGK